MNETSKGYALCLYVFYNEKGQFAKKDHVGAKIDLRAKYMAKYKYLGVFWKLYDPVPMLLQEVNSSST